MTGRVTSVMVAQVAGVSQAAVSRVFTPGASVSKKTAEKVKRAAITEQFAELIESMY